jgi:uncharacterized NAD(P)/FAD-binding protein YdhS
VPPTPSAPASTPALCLVGVGPRGTCVIERLAAIARDELPDKPWMLHLVDEHPFGAGRIWRMDQTHELCMNTLSGAVTLFTDEASSVMGPVSPGPTLQEWCLLVRDALFGTDDARDVPPAHRAAFERTPLPAEFLQREHLRAETRIVRPESHPSRALYGAYITWCFDDAIGRLPASVRVIRHTTRAVGIENVGDRERVRLADGTELEVDDVVLSLGWLESTPPPAETAIATLVDPSPQLLWVRPGSPAEQELDLVPPRATAIVRGLGMGFFDAMALLTIGRGGRFEGEGLGLAYVPTGEEPTLHVTSRRGVPFRAKSLWGGLPPAAVQTYYSRFDRSALDRPVDFEIDLWPRILQDAQAGWYRALAETRPEAFEGSLGDVFALIDDAALVQDARAFDEAVSAFVQNPDDRFDLIAQMSPAPDLSGSPAEFDRWVREYLRADLAEAAKGAASPLKRALWEVNAARQPTAKYMAFAGATAESHSSRAYRAFASFGAMIGSGPPAFRNAQLLALAEAGLVSFIGADGVLTVDGHGFTCASPHVVGSRVHADVLVDAFMNFHDARTSVDPLVSALSARGHVRPHPRPTRAGGWAPGPGIDVEPGTSRVVGADGRPVDRIHIIGLPVEDTRGDTVISPMPRINATFLREADGVAHAALRTLYPHHMTPREALFV